MFIIYILSKPLFPTFLLSVSLLAVIWSYPEQLGNRAFVYSWSGCLEQSTTAWTFVRHLRNQHRRRLFIPSTGAQLKRLYQSNVYYRSKNVFTPIKHYRGYTL